MSEAEAPLRGEGRGCLLSHEEIFSLASLEVRARVIAEGLLVGAHRSKRFGASTEFAEHKLYAPGDELKHLDWKTYARTDRYFVRRYEEEANLDIYLIVDASGSMAYAGGARGAYGIPKLEYAATLIGALAYLAAKRSDALSLTLFAGEERLFLPPRARRDHLAEILGALESIEPAGPTEAVRALEAVVQRVQRRALVVLASDLLDVGEDALGPLGILRRRGADVIVLHTLDRDELDFPFDGVVRFEDLEGDREVQVDAPGVREAYLQELEAFLSRVRLESARRDLRYYLAPTDRSPVLVLREALDGVRVYGGRR